MFGIIYWENDKKVKPILNGDGTLTVFNTIAEAEDHAAKFEASNGFAAGVISLAYVHEN